MKTYLLTYTVYYKDGASERKQMKVHKCMNLLHAKIKLGEYLKRNSQFKDLVIHDDIFSMFNEIFGK